MVDTVSNALKKNGGMTAKAIDRWYKEMPREEEMLPKDKYTIFDRKERKYRKGIHSRCNCSSTGIMTDAICRATKVDESQPTRQSAGFLSHPPHFHQHSESRMRFVG